MDASLVSCVLAPLCERSCVEEPPHELAPACHVELATDVGCVLAYRFGRDVQILSDLSVRRSAAQVLENLSLPST